MKNKAKVMVNGVKYSLLTSEPEQYIHDLAAEVDGQMQAIIGAGDHVSALMAAVLAAINLCDEKNKLERDADNLRGQLKNYIEDAGKMRSQCVENAKEVARLENELKMLRQRHGR